MVRGERARRAGAWGEGYAADCLRQDGYTILHRNLRTPHGELDIVARKGDILAIVEVKTRAASGWGSPGEAVNLRKQRRLIAASLWLLCQCDDALQPRFDVFEVIAADGPQGLWALRHRHIEGAFDCDETNRPD